VAAHVFPTDAEETHPRATNEGRNDAADIRFRLKASEAARVGERWMGDPWYAAGTFTSIWTILQAKSGVLTLCGADLLARAR